MQTVETSKCSALAAALLLVLLPVTSSQAATAVPATHESSHVALDVTDGKVTGTFDGTPLRSAMSELARLSGFSVEWRREPDACPISVCFAGVPVREAIDRLLRGANYLVLVETRDRSAVVRLVVLDGTTSGCAPSAPIENPPSSAAASDAAYGAPPDAGDSILMIGSYRTENVDAQSTGTSVAAQILDTSRTRARHIRARRSGS